MSGKVAFYGYVKVCSVKVELLTLLCNSRVVVVI